MTYPATNLNEAVGLIVPDSNALHDIINGDAEDIVITPEGREVPTVLKAMADSLLFKDPIPWEEGSLEQDPLQLRTFTDGLIYWAPTAQLTNPIAMGASPIGDSNWKISPIIKSHNSLANRDKAGAHPASAIGWYDYDSDVIASNNFKGNWKDAVRETKVNKGANTPVVVGSAAIGAEEVPVQFGLPSGVTGFHLSQGDKDNPSTDKRPIVLVEKVCDSVDTDQPHTMFNLSMRYLGGEKGAIPLSSYVEATDNAQGGAIAIKGRSKTTVASASGWGGWSYVDVQNVLPIRAIGHEINVRCNLQDPLTWSASGGEIDGLVVAMVDNGQNNMAHSAIKLSKSSSGLGFLTGIKVGYDAIIPSDTSNLSVLNGEAMLINGANQNIKRYGGIRIAANDGAGFNRFHYGLRTSEAEFNNNVAIWLGEGHRIRWGSALNAGPHINVEEGVFNAVGGPINVNAGSIAAYRVNGSKVVGERRTGWEVQTGTTSKADFNSSTVTTEKLGEVLKALISDLRVHGLIGD